jgi:AcrR family transcriptional regulator
VTQPDRRQELLDAAVSYVAEQGFADVSLRRLAEAVGTSHRMLIHYFGSKEGLWAEIVGEVERRQLELFKQFRATGDAGIGETMRAWWQHISDRMLWPNERLFFEVYAQALQGRAPATGLVGRLVEPWVDVAAAGAQAAGIEADRARASARLGLAVTRGLLLDLLATGDTSGVDAAMEEWIRLFESGLGPPGVTPADTDEASQ